MVGLHDSTLPKLCIESTFVSTLVYERSSLLEEATVGASCDETAHGAYRPDGVLGMSPRLPTAPTSSNNCN